MIVGYVHVEVAIPAGDEPALLVEDLEHAVRAAGYPTIRADGEIAGVRRFHTEDPFGNRLEFQQA